MGNAGYEIGSARENRTEAGHFKLDTVERAPTPVIRRRGSHLYKEFCGTDSHARHPAAWEPLLQNIVGRAPMPVTRRRGSRFYKISWDGLPCPSSGGVGAASTKNSAGRTPTPVARQRSCLYIKKSSSPPYRTASRAPRPSRTSCAAGRHPG